MRAPPLDDRLGVGEVVEPPVTEREEVLGGVGGDGGVERGLVGGRGVAPCGAGLPVGVVA
ncbi:MAG: hypothetical protein AVDCRST_MAG19-2757 [uncultured Thermomicrobiales bacterium]|uniref:Uncharacterized protein n=1 Tax=uncultured Thermomicrobiales bacterium TaxID=1645740 RepID=A0A6J4V7Z6_9BACT|nr:MAG: hypothetical protein AVDCRST_MAG19-2757 [uncultured Thermomicrobiales bacterium]